MYQTIVFSENYNKVQIRIKMASEKFTLSDEDQETYKGIEILHVFPNDKDADLPLLSRFIKLYQSQK